MMADRIRHVLKVFSGNAHAALAREISEHLQIPLADAYVGRFPDGEVRLQIKENVRGADVFVIQPTCHPVNENLMELLIMLDALRRASAYRITAVMPYYGYARQDRKDRPRVPISSKLVADLLTSAGTDRILALDLSPSGVSVLPLPSTARITAPSCWARWSASAAMSVSRAKRSRVATSKMPAPCCFTPASAALSPGRWSAGAAPPTA